MRARSLVTLPAACATLAACASLSACAPLGNPVQTHTGAESVAATQTTHELATPAPRQTVAGPPASTPKEAVRRFAVAYINWTAETVADDMRSLAAQSVGQARSALQLAAAQTAGDYELKRGGIANSGTVEAVAGLAGARTRYVVVTRERTTAASNAAYQGLRPAWHVAIATVVPAAPGGWVLSGWQPES